MAITTGNSCLGFKSNFLFHCISGCEIILLDVRRLRIFLWRAISPLLQCRAFYISLAAHARTAFAYSGLFAQNHFIAAFLCFMHLIYTSIGITPRAPFRRLLAIGSSQSTLFSRDFAVAGFGPKSPAIGEQPPVMTIWSLGVPVATAALTQALSSNLTAEFSTPADERQKFATPHAPTGLRKRCNSDRQLRLAG